MPHHYCRAHEKKNIFALTGGRARAGNPKLTVFPYSSIAPTFCTQKMISKDS